VYYDVPTKSINPQVHKTEEKVSVWSRIKNLFAKNKDKDSAESDTELIDALQFFKLVKLSSKDSVSTYRDRVADYLKAVYNAASVGQVALLEDLIRGMVTNKYEAVLYSEGYYNVLTEEQIVKFVKKCEKGIKLDYIKNFTRPLPFDVVEKVNKLNDLEIFDNYVVLYYDPDGHIYKETAAEQAKRRDPILFGVIAGSNKLYYVADWEDEYCDLSLEKFIDTIGVTMEQIHMDYDPNAEAKKAETPEPDGIIKSLLNAVNSTSIHAGGLLSLMTLSICIGGIIDRAHLNELLPQTFGSPILAMAVLFVILVIIGMIMDPYGAVILVSATLTQIAAANGIGAVHFWMTVLCAFELGYLTPPVALNQLLTRQVVGEKAYEYEKSPDRPKNFWWRHEQLGASAAD
jgi:hypothetical protein